MAKHNDKVRKNILKFIFSYFVQNILIFYRSKYCKIKLILVYLYNDNSLFEKGEFIFTIEI